MRWLELNFMIPPNLFILWENWDGVSAVKKMRNGFRMIWHAVVWCIAPETIEFSTLKLESRLH
jgi:hypothetical protein